VQSASQHDRQPAYHTAAGQGVVRQFGVPAGLSSGLGHAFALRTIAYQPEMARFESDRERASSRALVGALAAGTCTTIATDRRAVSYRTNQGCDCCSDTGTP
jgi:hypothetical protein